MTTKEEPPALAMGVEGWPFYGEGERYGEEIIERDGVYLWGVTQPSPPPQQNKLTPLVSKPSKERTPKMIPINLLNTFPYHLLFITQMITLCEIHTEDQLQSMSDHLNKVSGSVQEMIRRLKESREVV